MRGATTVPTWSYPLILALLGLVLLVGDLSPGLQASVGAESLLFLGYLFLRSRRTGREGRTVAKLLPLFPGHLLLLFAISLLSTPKAGLIYLWMIVPAATAVYDLISFWSFLGGRVRMSISAGLYCIIWADLFFLLERVIALGRELSGGAEIVTAAMFGLVGTAFLFVGAYRHWRASKL